MNAIRLRKWFPAIIAMLGAHSVVAADFEDPNADREALPTVPPGFTVSFFAREPLVRQPCSMAFDSRGRLCVGMGPQYRNPKPDTPGDSVVLVLDTDGDGRADRAHVFATGFNAIQGLAWHGRDLWVANSPDLTVVRDLDGDDVADEYVRVYTDLGNLEHGLHGLNWAPDGRLYMSKGNSKGLTQPGRVAPKPFRDLWGVVAPAGTPDLPSSQTFSATTYRHSYHDPEDDWGREGGILRCEDGGRGLEIVSRGFRNPWDIAFDSGFNWLGTDNDQTQGDRVFMPFPGAHFGWNHPWSSHWGVAPHAPTAPVSGPLFEGSGTGVVFADSARLPAPYRGVFFINDWLQKTTFVWRPRWDGALMRPEGGTWEPFVTGGRSLFRPTDIEVGPDGALWILGWGSGYGAEYRDGQLASEGRVFRVASSDSGPIPALAPKRSRPMREWSVAELVEDLNGPLPVWRIDAQDELVRRGTGVRQELIRQVGSGRLSEAQDTWLVWALGRIMGGTANTGPGTAPDIIDGALAAWALDSAVRPNLRIQSIRVLAYRVGREGSAARLDSVLRTMLGAGDARLRFEAVQAMSEARRQLLLPELLGLLAVETDPTTFYAGWQALRRMADGSARRAMLPDRREGVALGALLGLLEDGALSEAEVRALAGRPDSRVAGIAGLWLGKAAGGGEKPLVRGRPLASASSAQGNRVDSVADTPSRQPGAPIRALRSRGRPGYELVRSGLGPMARPYSDRGYTLKSVPKALLGADYIRTPNDDDGSRGRDWLGFEAIVPIRVTVALDARTRVIPGWLREGWTASVDTIVADHWAFRLFSREYESGPVVLGGNTESGEVGGKGNYIVVIEPHPVPAPSEPTGVDAVLPLLGSGGAGRGEWLFHHQTGAGCFNCHRLGGHGNAFAPDLATVGSRSTVRHLVESILSPEAVITEGYHLHTLTTEAGEISGILLEESGLSVTLGLPSGRREVILRTAIKAMSKSASSAMPAYDGTLRATDVADLTAYLRLQTGAGKPEATPAGGAGWRIGESEGRLEILHDGAPVARFVYRDERILRPYLAGVHAPGGIQVTRNHPPIAGVDAVDHDTMHPGIWLGLGDISGADFWRNKGRMEHVGFLERPVADGRGVRFRQACRLVAPDGREICRLTNRIVVEAVSGGWLFLWEAAFGSAQSDFSFGDQEEMGFGARVATPLTEKAGGLIRSSTGRSTAKDTWGLPAEWCDYSGVVGEARVGITLLAHPDNFRGSWWHNRDYGVFVANPFGRAAMKQGAPSVVTIRRGEPFVIRFGAVAHAGVEGVDRVRREEWMRRLVEAGK